MKYECLLNYLYEHGLCENCVEPYPCGEGKISLLPKDIENEDDLMIAEWKLDIPKPTEAMLKSKKYQDSKFKQRLRDRRYKLNKLKENELYPVLKVIFKKLNILEDELFED